MICAGFETRLQIQVVYALQWLILNLHILSYSFHNIIGHLISNLISRAVLTAVSYSFWQLLSLLYVSVNAMYAYHQKYGLIIQTELKSINLWNLKCSNLKSTFMKSAGVQQIFKELQSGFLQAAEGLIFLEQLASSRC